MKTMSTGRASSAILCMAILAVVLIAGSSLSGAAASTRQTDTCIRIPLPEYDTAVQLDAYGLCRFTGTDIQQMGQTGEPSIPYKAITVLLPPDADLASVRAQVSDYSWTVLDGEWDVAPVQPLAAGGCENAPAVSLANKAVVDGKDADIYNTDAFFPLEPIRKVDTQVMREWKMAQVFYALYAYNPVDKQLYQLSGSAIEITFERTSLKSSPSSTDFTGAEQVREMTANFTEMAGEYGGYAASPATGRYVIITTSAIETASVNLADFVASREARGFAVQVVTEETWGGGTGDTAAERIRSWLQDNYLSLNIKYVLLIGNPHPSSGSVPMKTCYCYHYDYETLTTTTYEVPTDFYYAELTSDWDVDNDGRYGEYDDDFSGNPPRAAEVAVGRIPYYGSISDLDHILSKIMGYEATTETDTSWHRNVLLPMKPSDPDTPGYYLGEEIKDDILVPNGWTYHRVYDEDYDLDPPPETTPCTVTNVTDAWNGTDFGAAFWWTHGWETGASGIMDLSHAATLDDEHPSFAFQCSCSNGTPELSNNLGYSLLKNGCIATVSASRVSWYEQEQTSFAGTATNSGMTFEYSNRLIAEEMYAGDALNDLRLDVSPEVEELWMNYLDFNLYGCPAVALSTPPLTTTNDATDITGTSARLNGNLTSLGTAGNVTVSFEWGPTSGGPYTPIAVGTKDGIGAFTADLGGLTPGNTYCYRAKAAGHGTTYGNEETFTTTITPPSVTTNHASNMTTTSATLNGNLSSLGTAASVSVSFQWGTSPGLYEHETAAEVKDAPGSFLFDLGGLAPDTVFYYRAKAVGHGTPQFGTERSFTTGATPPSVITSGANNITTSSAKLNGNLISLGTASSVTVSFVWGTISGSYPYETISQLETGTGAFYFDLGSLALGTTYYYKAKAVGHGTNYGAETVFTTLRPPEVESVNPVSGRLGQNMTVMITGSNLTGVTEVSFGPGTVVDSLLVENAAQVSVTIHIGCDVIPGSKDVSVTTPGAGGTSTLPGGFAVVDLAPNQPHNIGPANGTNIATLTPILSSTAFSHACPARSHTASQWQVTTAAGDYSTTVFDSGADSVDLAAITLPRAVVGGQEFYWWRVRYQDNRGNWSDWSTETNFACPDFVRAELDGPAEIRVRDSSSRVTGSVDGRAREEIAYSDYFSDTVTVVSPTDPYRYEVVGTEDGTYTLTIAKVIGGQSVAFRAFDIPLSAGDVHQYVIDWDALSQGEKSVTIRIDTDGDGGFDKSGVVDGEVDADRFLKATSKSGMPIWVWICVGIGALFASGLFVLLVRARRNTRTDAVS